MPQNQYNSKKLIYFWSLKTKIPLKYKKINKVIEGQKGYTAGICPFSICENQLPLLHSHEQEIRRTASENTEIFQRFLKN